MKRRQSRNRRLPKKNNRERKQSYLGLNERKREAWEELFGGMEVSAIIHELNMLWVDSRYRLVIIPIGTLHTDGQILFEGWEVNDDSQRE
jgi:hypothetical protein